MLHQNALQAARITELKEQYSKVKLWILVRQQPRWPQRALCQLGSQRRLMVVVIRKEPNQLYGVVGTVAGLSTTHKCAEKI
jgi:hypothetical protein